MGILPFSMNLNLYGGQEDNISVLKYCEAKLKSCYIDFFKNKILNPVPEIVF